MHPLITVIIPCYNQGAFLSEAMDSVLAQTYENWECIIINDGSTDNTPTVANKYTTDDQRFKYICKENGGLSSARNTGLAIATGEYIQFLDADDFIHKDKFRAFVDILQDDPTCQLVICNFNIYQTKSGEFLAPYCDLSVPITLETIICNWDITFTIPIHCGIIKKDLIGSFNEDLKAKEDWIMWINIFKQIGTYYFMNESQAFYRGHESNMSSESLHMEKNTISAYNYIYSMIGSETLKDKFFLRYSSFFTALINHEKQTIINLKNSNSYKLGNFILKPISFIKQFISR